MLVDIDIDVYFWKFISGSKRSYVCVIGEFSSMSVVKYKVEISRKMWKCVKMKRRTMLLAVLCVLLSLSCGLSGQDMLLDDVGHDELFDLSLEELSSIDITSVSFFNTSSHKAPGFVMSYDMDELVNSPVRTLSDLFDMYVPGAISGTHERQGRLIGTRGIMVDNNAKTLVMWDGQQINFRTHFGYMVGMLSPFMGDISNIEVIHGPGAIIHGSGAINGFVNMIPKTGESHPGGFARFEYGVKEQSTLSEAGYGFEYGENRNVYIYGGNYYADGYETTEGWGAAREYSEDIKAFGFVQSNYRVSTTWNHDNFGLNLFKYELNPQKNSNREYGYFMNEALGVRPKYTFELSDTDSVEMSLSMLWMDFGDIGANGSRGMIMGGSEHHWDVKGVYRTTAFEGHQLAFGGLFGKKHYYDNKFFFTKQPQAGFESINTMWEEASLFGEDVVSLGDSLTMSLGLRYDKFHTDPIHNSNELYTGADPGKIPGHTSPRIAFAYELDKETTVKASYQHGFRMPDAVYYNWNLYNNAVASSLGYANSPLLKPEEMDSYELNFEKILTKRLTLNTNLYYNVFKDQLSWGELTNYWTQDEVDAINVVTDSTGWGGGMFQNIAGDFAVYGTEVILGYELTEKTDVNVSYSFAKVENNCIEQHYPPHQVKAMVKTKLIEDKLLLCVNYLYNSSYSEDINPIINDIYKSPRHVIDLAMVYQVTDNFRVKGVAKNVFGELTPPPGFRMNVPNWGNVGYDEPRYYLTAELGF